MCKEAKQLRAFLLLLKIRLMPVRRSPIMVGYRYPSLVRNEEQNTICMAETILGLVKAGTGEDYAYRR